jgi:hypothetical protein
VTLFLAYDSSWVNIRNVGSGIRPAIPATWWPSHKPQTARPPGPP